MRIRTVALTAAAALTVAAAALAAPAVKDPKTLILKQADFPAHSDYEAGDELDYSSDLGGVPGADVEGYFAGIYSKPKDQLLQVHGAVITTPDTAKATKAFALAEKHLEKQFDAKYQGARVPKYGDQQDAFSLTPKNPIHSKGSYAIVVRKRSTVWVLWVLIDKTDPLPKMSDVLAGLETYAAKQKSHVGAG